MFRVSFSRDADQDIDSKLNYIAVDSPASALSFVDRLETKVLSLLSSPPSAGRQLGKARFVAFGNDIVAHLVDERSVTVVLVSEGHRHWQKLLEDRQPS